MVRGWALGWASIHSKAFDPICPTCPTFLYKVSIDLLLFLCYGIRQGLCRSVRINIKTGEEWAGSWAGWAENAEKLTQ